MSGKAENILWILSCLFIVLSTFGCGEQNSNPKSPNHNKDTSLVKYDVSVNANKEESTVSPLLMGFNIVYPKAKDAEWQNGTGPILTQLKKIGTGILRWPGGTVTTFYHWKHLTGQGHKDRWDSSFDFSKNKPPSFFMSLDEYLDICQTLHTEPLIGINMASGMKYHRVQDGIDEAKALVQHCMNRGVPVKFYYLGNEPYQEDANYTFTAEEYAKEVNLYAAAIKKINPNIKIIVNGHPGNDKYTETIIKKAGKNIDYVDIHSYWSWHNASFKQWKSQPEMKSWRGFAYSNERSYYRNMFQKLGYPNIDLVVLEWNIGPKIKGDLPYPSEAEVALMDSEQFTQFIQSGMKMACLWPIAWPSRVWSNRGLLNAQDGYSSNKLYTMFGLYSDILGQQKIKSSVSAERLINLAVKSKDGKKIWIYLINKNLHSKGAKVNLSIDNFKPTNYKAVGFESSDDTPGPLDVHKIKIAKKSPSHFTLRMPQFSFAKITLKK